jgi:hypothetical protein
MEQTDSPETPVPNHFTPRNTPENEKKKCKPYVVPKLGQFRQF